jgi:hypothetical protein
MAEPSNAPEFIIGDKAKPRVRVRHKRNIVLAEATFEHADRVQLGRDRVSPVKPRALPQLVEVEGDSKISLLIFESIDVLPESLPGLYECTSLNVQYANGAREMVAVPEDLKFRIVDDPPDTPEVSQVEWGNPHAD